MYNLASKLLGPLCDPFILAVVLAVCALVFWKRRRLSFRLLVISIALLLIFGSGLVATALARSLESQSRDSGLNVPPAQAIVVLGGAIHMPGGIHHQTGLIDASDRLLAAFRLYRAGKAPLIFCSGGNNPLAGYAGQTAESVWFARLLEEWDVPSAAIEVESGSINTHENAVRTYQALAPRGIRRILLVTSAMHMPRAAGAFRKVGFDVIAAPADFHSGWREPGILIQCLPSASNLGNSEAALHEWLGIAVYRLHGWI